MVYPPLYSPLDVVFPRPYSFLCALLLAYFKFVYLVFFQCQNLKFTCPNFFNFKFSRNFKGNAEKNLRNLEDNISEVKFGRFKVERKLGYSNVFNVSGESNLEISDFGNVLMKKFVDISKVLRLDVVMKTTKLMVRCSKCSNVIYSIVAPISTKLKESLVLMKLVSLLNVSKATKDKKKILYVKKISKFSNHEPTSNSSEIFQKNPKLFRKFSYSIPSSSFYISSSQNGRLFQYSCSLDLAARLRPLFCSTDYFETPGLYNIILPSQCNFKCLFIISVKFNSIKTCFTSLNLGLSVYPVILKYPLVLRTVILMPLLELICYCISLQLLFLLNNDDVIRLIFVNFVF